MPADGAIAICEMLFQTSLVALVGIGDEHTMSPRKLQITNTKVQFGREVQRRESGECGV
jgi:autophagy-related protein 18